MFNGVANYPALACQIPSSPSKLLYFGYPSVIPDPSFRSSLKRAHEDETEPEGDKMSKLLRERSTAQKRRQSKREELTKLGSLVQDLETKLSKLKSRLDGLSDFERQQVLAAQARAGSAPLGCRLCSILDRREEFPTVDRLVHHFRVHHVSDLRQRGDDFVLQAYATNIPTEDGADMSDNDENDSDEDTPEELTASASDSTLEMKRKLRLKRNAASARKSRKRKRVQLERWRMILPSLRFQADTLETALGSVSFARAHIQFEAEPDVVSAAFALIGCSLSAPRTMT